MAKSELAMPHILKWEGGYSNHPKDKGGCTMKGITIATYKQYYGNTKTCSDLQKLTDQEWLNIFKKGYWDKCKGDYILNQSIANIIVDWAWNSGVKTAIKEIQRILNIKDDGIVGEITLSSLNKQNQSELFNKIYKARVNFYINICEKDSSQKVFLNGWMNRINDFIFSENETPSENEIIENENIQEESNEEIKKHFTDIMSDFSSAFLFK